MPTRAKTRARPAARKPQVLSADYIDRHLPENEFSPRDFERIGEMLHFARSVSSALMHAAKRHPEVERTTGPKRLKVTLSFTLAPETRKGKGNCIRVGGYASGPSGSVHIPCLVAEGRDRYSRDE